GRATTDYLTINDKGTTGYQYTLTDTLLSRPGAADIVFGINTNSGPSSVRNVILNAGAGDDILALRAPVAPTAFVFDAAGGSNVVTGADDVTSSWLINNPNGGSVGRLAFKNVGTVRGGGGSADNTFTLLTNGSLTGGIFGGSGPGTNTLKS